MELTLREGISLIFILIGTGFIFIAGLGIVRMPDLFLRMSMTTKASTLGVGSMLAGCIVFFWNDAGVITRVFATIVFLLLTAPVSAHLIGRAGYIDPDVQLWRGTKIDELAGQYDLKRQILASITDLEAGEVDKPDQTGVEKALSNKA
ncbi:MAG TPA: monovalent cation/H(+) antiporter subunit G [Aggregatilineales bacterium]|nr:monovalent cation/H(+) antiporter subunit G [Aggregatilineales bacterium]